MVCLMPADLFTPVHSSSEQPPSLLVQPTVSVSCSVNQSRVTFTPTDCPPPILPLISQSPSQPQLTCIMTTPHRPLTCFTTTPHHPPTCVRTTAHHPPTCVVTTPHRPLSCVVTTPHRPLSCVVTTPHRPLSCVVTTAHHPPICVTTMPHHLSVTLPQVIPSSITALFGQSQVPCLLPTHSQPVSTYLPITLPPLGYQTSVSVMDVSHQPSPVSTSNVQHLWNETLPLEQKFTVLSQLFCKAMQEKHNIKVPSDFLELAAAGMVHLLDCNRANVIYLLARALGSMRADESDSLLPAKRMPMGLIEHTINFFNAEHVNEVS